MGIATGSTRALYFSIEKGGGPLPRGTKGTESSFEFFLRIFFIEFCLAIFVLRFFSADFFLQLVAIAAMGGLHPRTPSSYTCAPLSVHLGPLSVQVVRIHPARRRAQGPRLAEGSMPC